MASSREGTGISRTAIFVTMAVACALVIGFVSPAMAHSQSMSPLQQAGLFQQDGGEFSCAGMTKAEISQRLNNLAADEINAKLRQNSERIPATVRNAMVGERINIRIDSTYFATVINENAQIERIETQRLDNPTVRVTTDCATLERIYESDNRQAALQTALNNDDIQWEGLTTTSDVETSYGSKAVQTYTIVESGETGDTQDATRGFSSGLMLE